jgi:outer membrane biosynthesis protein TonB
MEQMETNKNQNSVSIRIRVMQDKDIVFEGEFDSLPISIGRSSSNKICLRAYPWLSRNQAILQFNGDQYELIDLTGTDKLFYENKGTSRCLVTNGSRISIGNLYFNFDLNPREGESLEEEDTSSNTATATAIHLEDSMPQKQAAQVYVTGKNNPRPNISDVNVDFESSQGDGRSSTALPVTERPNAVINGLRNYYRGARRDLMAQKTSRVLEAFVSWKGQILEIREFAVNERVHIGPSSHAALRIPIMEKDIVIARFNGTSTRCLVPHGTRMRVRRGQQLLQRMEIEQSTQPANSGYIYNLAPADLVTLDLGNDVRLHIRYAPAPRQLTKAKFVEPDEEIQRTFLGSGIIHLFFALMGVFAAPKDGDMKPRLIAQTQVARLVVPEEKTPEKPTPVPTPEPIATPPPVAKKPKPIKKVQPKPEAVVVKKSKPINEFPMTLPSKRVAKTAGNVDAPSKEVSIKNISALAALGSLGAPSDSSSSQPVAININPNAGGMKSSSASGVIGALKAPGGKLQGAGMQGVRTKGQGYGTGTGYGVQGVKGTAGGRAVAGGVVGMPKLMKITREEGLTQKAVMAVVQKHLGEIQRCYERALLGNPDLVGRVEYEWSIDPSGSVKWARVKKTDISDGDNLNSCVSGVFKAMSFPRAKNGMPTTANIGFPFGRL